MPWHSLMHNGALGFVVLGAVFLAVTGAEALYADLGHFGRGPIQLAWVAVAFPALTLNYFGQGAMVLADPATESDRSSCFTRNGRFCPLCSLPPPQPS